MSCLIYQFNRVSGKFFVLPHSQNWAKKGGKGEKVGEKGLSSNFPAIFRVTLATKFVQFDQSQSQQHELD
jgi:hypothetical protein